MKYKLKYSPDACIKLKEMRSQIEESFGSSAATRIMSDMMRNIRGLQENPGKGVSVEAMLGISSTYRVLHVEHNYVFYRVENGTVFVVDIFHERENYLWRMFRVNLRTQESIDFWGE